MSFLDYFMLLVALKVISIFEQTCLLKNKLKNFFQLSNKNFVLLETSLNSKLLKKNLFFSEYIKGYFYFLDMREEYVVV
jgi:hypothetical protein